MKSLLFRSKQANDSSNNTAADEDEHETSLLANSSPPPSPAEIFNKTLDDGNAADLSEVEFLPAYNNYDEEEEAEGEYEPPSIVSPEKPHDAENPNKDTPEPENTSASTNKPRRRKFWKKKLRNSKSDKSLVSNNASSSAPSPVKEEEEDEDLNKNVSRDQEEEIFLQTAALPTIGTPSVSSSDYNSTPAYSLANKTVVIVGTAAAGDPTTTGIGFVTAQNILQSGGKVVLVNYVESVIRALVKSGDPIHNARSTFQWTVDNSNEESIEHAWNHMAETLPTDIHHVVLLASSITKDERPLLDMSFQDFQKTFHSLVGTQFLHAKYAVPKLANNGSRSSIVFTTATSASMANAAVQSLCKSLADELAPRGVRVNCLSVKEEQDSAHAICFLLSNQSTTGCVLDM